MPKRQSTTAKVTRRIARLISDFCRYTRQGVMCRVSGSEIGIMELNGKSIPSGLCVYKRTLEQLERLLCSVPLTTKLADCKTTDRYLVDYNGNEYWVFGLPENCLLVRRIVMEGDRRMMKPVRTMDYSEVSAILN